MAFSSGRLDGSELSWSESSRRTEEGSWWSSGNSRLVWLGEAEDQ